MTDIDGLISTFVSRHIRGALSAEPALAYSQSAETVEFYASVLMIDISGFTAMTEKFERLGPEGVEQLTSALDRHFGAMIAEVLGNGGEVSGISGDALLAYWPADHPAQYQATVQQALLCATKLQEKLTGAALDDDTQLEIHSALSAGHVSRLFVGGHDDHRLSVITGDPLSELGDMLPFAAAGDLILSAAAHEHVLDVVSTAPVGDGLFRLTDMASDELPSADDAADADIPNNQPISAEAERKFLNRGLRRQLDAGHEAWLAEIRSLSVGFISAPVADADDAEALHSIAIKIQEIAHGYGGVVHELVHDDKGMVFLLVFGLPGLSHADDTMRAVLATNDIRHALSGQGITISAGIATGMSYCGILGTDNWRCYSVRGTVVNRAARLMGAANGKLLADNATRQKAAGRVEFGPEQRMSFKGTGCTHSGL